METEADIFNRRDPRTGGVPKSETGYWQGLPGTEGYGYAERVGGARRIDNLIGPDGKALSTKEFTWAQFSETVFDEWRKAEIEKRVEQRLKEAEDKGEEISVVDQVQIRREITEEVEGTLEHSKNLSVFSNTLKAYQNRLQIVTGEIPEVFQNIQGVKGADGYLLVSGTRADNEKEIFGRLESLNNAGGNAKLDRIYSHRGGVLEGHGDADFFGWKVVVEDHTFVFIWDPNKSELSVDDSVVEGGVDEEGASDEGGELGGDVVNLEDRRKQKKTGEVGGDQADELEEETV